MENYDKKESFTHEGKDEIYSQSIRAGKRTYFFDVKATRKEDYYLTITESKKKFDKEGNYSFEKHKLFLYKEDFEKFSNGLLNAVEFIKETNEKNGIVNTEKLANIESSINISDNKNTGVEEFTNVEFEDLSE